MFESVALTLLKLMGHSGSIPGAFSAPEVFSALEKLKAQVSKQPHQVTGPDKINLRQRATPLLGLLQHAADKNYPVIWEY